MLTTGSFVFFILFVVSVVDYLANFANGKRDMWPPMVITGLIFAAFIGARFALHGV